MILSTREFIAEEIDSADFFGVLADETTDFSVLSSSRHHRVATGFLMALRPQPTATISVNTFQFTNNPHL